MMETIRFKEISKEKPTNELRAFTKYYQLLQMLLSQNKLLGLLCKHTCCTQVNQKFIWAQGWFAPQPEWVSVGAGIKTEGSKLILESNHYLWINENEFPNLSWSLSLCSGLEWTCRAELVSMGQYVHCCLCQWLDHSLFCSHRQVTSYRGREEGSGHLQEQRGDFFFVVLPLSRTSWDHPCLGWQETHWKHPASLVRASFALTVCVCLSDIG